MCKPAVMPTRDQHGEPLFVAYCIPCNVQAKLPSKVQANTWVKKHQVQRFGR